MIMIRETFLTYVISISSDDKFFLGGGLGGVMGLRYWHITFCCSSKEVYSPVEM